MNLNSMKSLDFHVQKFRIHTAIFLFLNSLIVYEMVKKINKKIKKTFFRDKKFIVEFKKIFKILSFLQINFVAIFFK